MMPLLAIRADADAKIGTGHVMRCLALAQEWLRQGGDVVFLGRIEAESLRQRLVAEGCQVHPIAASYPDPADTAGITAWLKGHEKTPGWLVLDGYHFDAAYHDAVRMTGWSLLVIDDYGHLPEYRSDILLNPNAYAEEITYKTAPETLRLLGSRFVPLRREFQEMARQPKTTPETGRKILITTGGTDPANVSGKVLQALSLVPQSVGLEIRIVVGSLNPHAEALAAQAAAAAFPVILLHSVSDMASLMHWADLAISAAGSTCWELACAGTPMVVTILADNQVRVADALVKQEVAVSLGWFDLWQPEQAATVIGEYMVNHAKRERAVAQGRKLVDGQGCERVVRAMRSFHFTLRLATENDCALVYQWANDPLVRAASFNSTPIAWKEHCRWFAEKMTDPAHVFLIAVARDGQPLGQVRFAIDNGVALISVSLPEQARGIGLGPKLIMVACHWLVWERSVSMVVARIKARNATSLNAFVKAGFQKTDNVNVGYEDEVAVVLDCRP